MSYLHLPRIVFTGDFQSDVSTVNNTTANYNNETFRPSFQEYDQNGKGLWNPEGGATFNFRDCTIQKLSYIDGTVAESSSLHDLIGEFIEGAEGRSAGKMVDLDPQQQLVSQLWAVRLRIVNKAGDEVLSGDLIPTAFRDLQLRQTDGGKLNAQPMGASWTSVLKNIQWGKTSNQYPILNELKATTQENCLSVNLNALGFYYLHAENGRFSLGKIIGAIGPWFKNEPKTFVNERRLFATKMTGQATYFSLSNFRFDAANKLLSIDFGNSIPVANSFGEITINNKYVLAISKYSLNNAPDPGDFPLDDSEFTVIGDLPYFQGDWLMKTGGIVDMTLTEGLSDLLKTNQLLLLKKVDTQHTLVAREAFNGLNVRADQKVKRIDANDNCPVEFYASQWGNPLASGSIGISLAPPTAPQPGPICPEPGINYPANGLSFTTNSAIIINGKAKFTITGNQINNPRGYLDGQIYFVQYQLDNSPTDYADSANNFISVHLRDYFPVPDKPKWTDIQETMQQFSNLYPIMSKYLVDLGNREAVLSRKDILLFAFSQDINSPMYMPVTRDLSEGKRLTIVKWLESGGKWDTEKISHPAVAGTAANAMRTMGKMEKKPTVSPINIAAAPTDFHQKLSAQMKMKMGEHSTFIEIDDLTKL